MASSLKEDLANALPEGYNFTLYHISTPPIRCDPIYSPPPSGKIERTYCESHFLQVSILQSPGSNDDIFIMAIECLIYTTKHLTTIFVSKADSTGYLALLSLPKSHESPLRTIASTFISYLVRHRVRPGIKLVVDLFARASDQYLYPGSVENPTKHVSDDRQLVKWWCRVLSPILLSYSAKPTTTTSTAATALFDRSNLNPTPPASQSTATTTMTKTTTTTTAQAYLIVPGEDSISSFLPPSTRYDATLRARWTHGHPLRDIATQPNVPPRCLIPHFPDDPKGRFVNELDMELPDVGVVGGSNNSNMGSAPESASGMAAAIKAGEMMAEGKGPRSPSKRGNGYWRSVRNLEQFWEMMAFRSECSSGRLVGFMWVVIAAPADTTETEENVTVSLQQSQSSLSSSSFSTTPPKKKTDNKNSNNNTTKPQTSTNKPKLSGRIISRLPRIKYANTSTNTTSNDLHNNLPSPSSPYYLWPPTSRGRLVLARKQYDKALELLLLRADFADERLGVRATRSWVDEVGLLGGVEAEAQAWGERVMGRKKMVATPVVRVDGEGDKSGGGRAAGERMVDGNGNGVAMATSMTMNVLSVKRKAVGGAGGGEGVEGKKVKTDEQLAVEPSAHHVNILGGGMVRKKPKKIQPTPVVQE